MWLVLRIAPADVWFFEPDGEGGIVSQTVYEEYDDPIGTE